MAPDSVPSFFFFFFFSPFFLTSNVLSLSKQVGGRVWEVGGGEG